MKTLLKLAYHFLRSLFAQFYLRTQGDGSLIILTYHRVLPVNSPAASIEQPGMVISPESLDQHITFMKSLAKPISLDDWISQKKQKTLKFKRYFAITFDDGWQDNYAHALPVLKKHQIPNTIFLVTKMVNTDLNFWPNRLGQLLNDTVKHHSELLTEPEFVKFFGHLNTEQSLQNTIDNAINYAKHFSDSEIHQYIDRCYEQHSELSEEKQRTLLNLYEIEALNQSADTNFGSHTQSHCRLHSNLQQEQMQVEIQESMQDLNTLASHRSHVFCYPNGDISEQAENLVQQHYNGACTTAQGINLQDCDPFKLKRFNLHNGNSGSSTRLLSTLLGKSESVYY